MGVKSLWTLLEPCGRRIDIKALRNKTLAIDASGWIFRFLKAMRDERGDILPNAHMIGFLRRICKLLFLNIRPVFVFDGSTPALKKRTVAERRRRREQQDARLKRTAEKLLLNRLKQHALREVEKAKTPSLVSELDNRSQETLGGASQEQQPTDKISDVVHVLAEENGKEKKSISAASSDESDEQGGFEVDVESGVDPEVLSTLPPSMQLEIMLQLREKATAAARGGFESRRKKPEEFSQYQIQQYLNSTGLRRKLDAIRGVARQNSDIAKPVAGEQDKHYVLYREEQNEESQSQDGDVCPSSTVVDPTESKALKISFCVQDNESDIDDMPWEDVEDEGHEGQKVNSERRSKYWSLSHGFQKGRSLGNWGEKSSAAEIEITPVVATEEQVMIDEAIKKSLLEQNTSYIENSEQIQKLIDREGLIGANFNDKSDEKPLPKNPDLDCQTGHSKTDQGPLKTLESIMPRKNNKDRTNSPKSAISKPVLPISTAQRLGTGGDDCGLRNRDNVDVTKSVCRFKTETCKRKCLSGMEKKTERDSTANNQTSFSIKPERENLDDTPNPSDLAIPVDIGERATKFQKGLIDPIKDEITYTKNSKVLRSQEDEKALEVEATSELFDLEQLAQEEAILRSDRRAATGQSDSPTEQMFTECQELLQMFGIPYIIAPTEAEAQCAWLDANKLVDGVVTDDNDAFLFGAKRVYRHIFEENKYVEEYRSEDVERELGFSRDSLILMALLLGSDYTPGIAGVGVVNAVEIISTFTGFEGLIEFKNWVNGVDEDLVALIQEDETNHPGETQHLGITEEFKQKHKTIRKSWVLPEDFPSQEVVESYQRPALDDSKSKFTFISPDFAMLESLCSRKFGWDEGKINDLFEPVKKSLSQRDKQQTIQGFLTFREKFARVRSKRLAQAVEKVKNKNSKRKTHN